MEFQIKENGMRNELIVKRLAKGMTQADMAKSLGLSNVVIWRLEKGDSIPRPKNIPSIARAYGMTPEELVAILYTT
jgi:transcriptional regulator with XRE-family HTH domain